MSNGSILIIDDWALAGAKLACEEYFEENGINLEPITIENSDPVYFIIKK